ncbi:hypothetical protein FB566_0795 [Stackebrandtia endophytica]|uniref:Polynucleotide kinase PNKP phosphatase domain-containing protein n=1 Tax=Stackebrandtia endophytica TaxID=1496996 RepID=A0A543ART9_9ACTN|nr:polynucleotide kinase [Stackebrandtia endophytica]TQL75298.1 hypothetical protein FB566_0795 [Stackebrandtia endophytica]
MTKTSAVIVDIDGTVAIRGDRSPYDESRVGWDSPNPTVIAVVAALHDAGHAIVFVTGRTSGCRLDTTKWLQAHVPVPYELLLMRRPGDQRPDQTIKRELYTRSIRPRYRVLCVLDDRDRVVKMWRGLGLTVLQVAEGDF